MKHACLAALAALSAGWAGVDPARAQEWVPVAQGGMASPYQEVLQVGDMELSADRISQRGDYLRLDEARALSRGRDGVITARVFEISNPDAVAYLMGQGDPDRCADEAPVHADFSFLGLTFIPDQDMSPRDGAPESLFLPEGSGTVSVAACQVRVTAAVASVSARGAGGSEAGASGLDVMLEGRVGDGLAGVRVSGGHFTLMEEGREMGLSIDEWGFSYAMTMTQAGSWMAALRDGDMPAVIRMMSGAGPSAGIFARGIDVDVERFLPPQEIERLGLSDVAGISGDVELSGNVSSGTAIMRAKVDFPGLAAGEVSLQVASPDGEVSIPRMITDRLPFPREVLGFRLVGARFMFEDDGFADMFERVRGERPEDMFERRASSLLEQAPTATPGGIVDLVGSALSGTRDILAHGGDVSISPDKPVSISAIGLRAIAMPSTVPGMLGVTMDGGGARP